MQIKARFIGDVEFNDYEKGKVYHIVIRENTVCNELRPSTTYRSIVDFLDDWLPLKPGD